jgi:hypothetical protein
LYFLCLGHFWPLEAEKAEKRIFWYLQVSRRPFRPFSLPFGFKYVLVGYQMKAGSVLSNIYFQNFKFELQI